MSTTFGSVYRGNSSKQCGNQITKSSGNLTMRACERASEGRKIDIAVRFYDPPDLESNHIPPFERFTFAELPGKSRKLNNAFPPGRSVALRWLLVLYCFADKPQTRGTWDLPHRCWLTTTFVWFCVYVPTCTVSDVGEMGKFETNRLEMEPGNWWSTSTKHKLMSAVLSSLGIMVERKRMECQATDWRRQIRQCVNLGLIMDLKLMLTVGR